VQAPTGRLVAHGYLAVLALGGTRVALWLLRRGLASPARIIDRLRGR
jgi:endonuclease YncB( thermonuclease family)